MKKIIMVLVLGLVVIAKGAGGVNDPYGLTALRNETAARSSSSAVDWANSNGDARPIAPGETFVLADLKGPGIVRHIWNTINAPEYQASQALVLRMYWDGETSPSVEVPLGDFFGVGHGMNVSFDSAMVCVTAEGKARNCYWPMPFRKSARITLTNEGLQPVVAFYYYVDWAKLPELPPDTPYFHAMYRQEYSCNPDDGPRFLVADIQGRGHYVGTVLNVRAQERGWIGEGDDFFYIDGEQEPSLKGTGTEDYFCDAWGFRESAGLYYGIPVYEGQEIQDRTSAYRWHVPDPVSFSKSLRLEIEHWGWWPKTNKDGSPGGIGDGVRTDDWSTVAYWYQIEPHVPFEPLPSARERHYYDWAEIIEAEALFAEQNITADRGGIGAWGPQVHWSVEAPLGKMEVRFDVEKTGVYQLVMALYRESYYGTFEFFLDGQKVGRNMDLYHPAFSQREYALDATRLKAGGHTLTIQNIGKNARSTRYDLGLDALLLVPQKQRATGK